MARNLNAYLDLMGHGLGKTPDSRHLLIDDFNDAGRALFQLAEGAPHFHSWSWVVRQGETFALPGGLVEEVALPADFGSYIAITFNRNSVRSIIPTTPEALAEFRRSFSTGSQSTWICFDVGSKQSNSQQPPAKVAAFWPPRDSALTDLRLTYRRTWVDMGTDDGNTYPDIPSEYERLMSLLARSYAVHIEDQTQAFEDQEVQRELARLVMVDAGKSPNKGQVTQSVRRRAGSRGSIMNSPFWGNPISRP